MAKKKQVNIIRWLNTGIYPATIMLSVGFSYDELMKHLKKIKAESWAVALSEDKELIESNNYFALQRIVENNKTKKKVYYYMIIITESFLFSDHEICKLAHEVLHIVQFLLKDILDINREWESFAYLHTHVMEQCLKQLRQ